jgi:uncharacterized protein YciI
MLYALVALDKPGALPVRQENRAAHLAYIAETGCVQMAGPFLDEAGGMIGSLLILDLPDMVAAEAWAANDPYAKAGLFDSVTVRAWKKVVG